jgi:hypothetical protein
MLPLIPTGCSKEQVDELTSKVKEQVTRAPEVVREALPATGKVSLTLDRSLEISSAEAELFQSGAAKSSLLQIRSYGKSDRETLPSVFLHAPVDAKTLNDMVGKVIEAQMFVRYDKGLDIWTNRDNEAVKLTIQSSSDGELVCQVINGVLVNPNGDSKPVSGEIRARINAQRQ